MCTCSECILYQHQWKCRDPRSDRCSDHHIRKSGFFTLSPIFIFIVIRYFFPSHSKNWIAQSTSQFHHPNSTPLLPQHYNILSIIASSIFIPHQNLSLNHFRMPSPIQCLKNLMLQVYFQSIFQWSRLFSISPYNNRF